MAGAIYGYDEAIGLQRQDIISTMVSLHFGKGSLNTGFVLLFVRDLTFWRSMLGEENADGNIVCILWERLSGGKQASVLWLENQCFPRILDLYLGILLRIGG